MNILLQLAVMMTIALYFLSLLFILLYSFTQGHLMFRYLFLKKKHQTPARVDGQFSVLPAITVQLPIFNEKYVAERLIDCIVQLDYPADQLEIQILDDSTDETTALIATKLGQLSPHLDIKHLRRSNRQGYKAGALKAALETASGEFIVLFDADFLPARDFLQKTLPHFISPRIGMVQTRWSWLNKNYSVITRMQAFALDAHFTVEQVGRNTGKGFINFNGTAGVWRKTCIVDAGNWQADTLTEDLDLSYRAQLKDWQFIYLEEVTAPSELPPVMSAVKSQQYRWNKGGAETARKHLRQVCMSSKSWSVKWHAMVHLLTSAVFLSAFTCTLLSVPILWIRQLSPQYNHLLSIANYGFISFLILGVMYLVTSFAVNKNKLRAMVEYTYTLPVFLAVSMGLALHNTIAVLEGFYGKKTPFVRTPKFNLVQQEDKWKGNRYVKKKYPAIIYAETACCIYFAGGIAMGIILKDYSFVPFHVLLLMGYAAVVYYTLSE